MLATAVFGLLWLWQVRVSEGFLEADACSHYLIARFAFDEPYRFVDIWGRPFKTLLFAGPAYLAGRTGVQATGLVLAVACAFLAMLWASDLLKLRRPSLAFVFTLAMPLVFLHSFSELTELPFALLLALAFHAYAKQRFLLAALLTGLLPLARPEGFGFLALLTVALLLQRRWAALPLLGVGLAVWTWLGWEAYGRDGPMLTWLPRHWPYAGDSVYASGSIFHFAALLPALVSPAAFPALLLGGWRVATLHSLSTLRSDPRARAALLLLALPLFVLTAHSVLYALGKMASNGELRYLLVTAPFWGVLVAAGWERAFDLLRRPPAEALRFAAYTTAVPWLINFHFYGVLPIRFDNAWEAARFVARFADAHGRATGRPALMAGHPGIYYFLDRSNNDPNLARELITPNIENPPPGTLLLYDPVYARFNASRDRRVDSTDDITRHGWQELPHFRLGGWRIYESPKPLPVSPTP